MKGGSAEIESRVCALRQFRPFMKVRQAAVELRAPLECCSEVAQGLGKQLWLPHRSGQAQRLLGIGHGFEELPVIGNSVQHSDDQAIRLSGLIAQLAC